MLFTFSFSLFALKMEYLESCHSMLSFERELWDGGFVFVAGVDEAGRGPLAGPVVVAAVIFGREQQIPKVNDSKKLTAKQRTTLFEKIIESAFKYSVVEIQSEEIDRINILQATHNGMHQAVQNLEFAQFVLIDGLPVPKMPVTSKSIVKGDSKSASIAAASILAKVHRDTIMDKYAQIYPQYGFERNKGYGTAKHFEAIQKYGISPIHRKTFEPIKSMLEKEQKIQMELNL